MDQSKLERLLRLMKLLTANTTYNIDQLAERLQMSRRTVYRYIDTFREAGFVIKKSGNCIRLDKESPHFRDISQLVHFTEEEAVILKSAIENIDDTNMLKQNLKRYTTIKRWRTRSYGARTLRISARSSRRSTSIGR